MNSSNSTNTINSLSSPYTIRTHIIYISIITILFVICYHDVLQWMYVRFMGGDSYYSHGFIIPFVSGFLIWQKRKELKKQRIEISGWGLLLITIAVLIHILGTILYVFSVSGFSIVFLIFGFSLFLLGKTITRKILFPLIFLIFMFPLPQAFISVISFPMKMLVAKVGADIVTFLGISVYREGFHITIPAGSLLVGNPCSGLRSLIAFLALGSVLAYLSSMPNIRKCLLFFLAIPIAILSNIIRVPILILLSHIWGIEAGSPESFWHDASGVFVFILGLLMLFYTGEALEWKKSEQDIS